MKKEATTMLNPNTDHGPTYTMFTTKPYPVMHRAAETRNKLSPNT